MSDESREKDKSHRSEALILNSEFVILRTEFACG